MNVRSLSTLAILWVLVMCTSVASAQLVPDFESTDISGAVSNAGCAPLIVQFNDLSTFGGAPLLYESVNSGGAYNSHEWDFGTGPSTPTSFEQNPTFGYSGPGTYTITLTVTNDGITYNSVQYSITVFPQPTVGFTADVRNGCDSLVVNFCDTSFSTGSNVVSWLWDFGDGSPLSTDSCPTHLYVLNPLAPNRCFTVTVVVENTEGCSQALTRTNYICIDPPPGADFSSTDSLICDPPFVTQFISTTTSINPVTYVWDFGDSTPVSNLADPIHTYDSTGNYSVTLIVTDSLCGLSDTVIKPAFIRVRDIDPWFTVSDTVICLGETVSFADSTVGPISTRTWDFGDATTSSLRYPSHTYADSGTYTVTLTVETAEGCQFDTVYTALVTVRPLPTAAFNAPNTTSCQAPFTVTFNNNSSGNNLSYLWQFGCCAAGSTLENPSFTYPVSGTYSVSLLVTDTLTGCSATRNRSNYISIDPTVINFEMDTAEGCVPLTVNFRDLTTAADPIVSWFWEFDHNGATFSGDSLASYTFPLGTWVPCLTVVTQSGCTGTVCQEVRVGDTTATAAFAINPNPVCVDEPVNFENNSINDANAVFMWDFVNSTSSDSVPPTQFFDAPDDYDISLTIDQNGCRVSQTIVLTVNAPSAAFSYDFDCVNIGEICFTDESIDADTYEWGFGDGTTSTDQSPCHTYLVSGVYNVTLTTSNLTTGCTVTKEEEITVSVLNADFSANNLSGCAPLTADFTNLSTGVDLTYVWDFGDPASGVANNSTSIDPSHTYDTPGQYEVTLTARDINNCLDVEVKTAYITVSGPTANFISPAPFGCVGSNNIQFNDLSVPSVGTTISSWQWDVDLGNPGFERTGQSPAPYSYTARGQYTVSLIVTDNLGCVDTATRGAYVDINEPEAIFNTGFNQYCAGQEIDFENNSIGDGLVYNWDFGDPLTNADTSSLFEPVYTYADTGVFTVTLTIQDVLGCTDQMSLTNAITVSDPQVSFAADDTFRFCPPHVVNFVNLSNFDTLNISSIIWDFGDGSFSSILNPSHIYNQAGTFPVMVEVTFENGCVDTATFSDLISVGGALANIITDDDTGCVAHTVCFDANTQGALRRFWLWGDGSSETGPDTLCHTYIQPGLYEPAIVLVDTQIPVCQYVLPYDTIAVDTVYSGFFTDGDSICQNQPISFFDTSASLIGDSISTWLWTFGDGTTDSVQNPVHSYAISGDYTVTLVATSREGCFSVATKFIFVRDKPTALFAVSDSIGCDSLQVTFTDASTPGDNPIASWYWDFGDDLSTSDTSILSNPPAYPYRDTGFYTVTLTVTATDGCADTAIQDIAVYPTPTGIGGADTIELCLFDTVNLIADSSAVLWDWSPGVGLNDSVSPSVFASPTDTTLYTLFTSDAVGCTRLDSVLINVLPLPNITVSPFPDTIICLGDTVQLEASSAGSWIYSWSPSTGLDNLNSATPLASPDGTTVYQILVLDSNSCSNTEEVRVIVNVFTPDFLGGPTCLGDPTSFFDFSSSTDFPIVSWDWNFDDPASGADSVGSGRNTSHIYSDSGTYNVQLVLTDPTGCTDTLVRPVRIDIPPEPFAGPDTIICIGDSVRLNAGGGDTIFWTPNLWLDDRFSYNPLATPEQNVVYTANITNGVCPFETAEAAITVIPTPFIETIEDKLILRGEMVELLTTADPYDTVFWSPPDSLSCVGCLSPLAGPFFNTTYVVTMIDQFGCTNTDSVEISVTEQCRDDQVYIGNGFTPNGDGINDVAYARLRGVRQLIYFRIFDRWGNLMFESNDETIGWTGKNDGGEQLSSGVYVYDIEAECFNGAILHKAGNITLIK